jgi:hypothetical protein
MPRGGGYPGPPPVGPDKVAPGGGGGILDIFPFPGGGGIVDPKGGGGGG